MIKTYEIDLEDSLVDSAGKVFEMLGSDIDSAITMFLKQSVLRKGFPFEVAVPEIENGKLKIENSETPDGGVKPVAEKVASVPEKPEDSDDLHGGVSEDEENAFATASAPPVSPEIAARVAANEALVAQMRNEIGEKAVTPEFDENEDDGTHGDYDSTVEVENVKLKIENSAPDAESSSEVETPATEEDSEDEDETTPENLFDAWDVGDEEDVGCK